MISEHKGLWYSFSSIPTALVVFFFSTLLFELLSTYQWQRACWVGKEWYLLTDSREGEAHKGTGQILCVHLIGHSFKVILLPCVLLNLTKKQARKCHMWRLRKGRIKQHCFPSNPSNPMWSADVLPHNISLVIISWSIIFMTWEQFFDRSKHLFNFEP